ncbi:hypothetical protein T484DRAFT_1918276 [Baffinella frigidus]|nr:hypothetical protein T484DRAFT_1918276 [Cryptophyta sp. CCMP2293]
MSTLVSKLTAMSSSEEERCSSRLCPTGRCSTPTGPPPATPSRVPLAATMTRASSASTPTTTLMTASVTTMTATSAPARWRGAPRASEPLTRPPEPRVLLNQCMEDPLSSGRGPFHLECKVKFRLGSRAMDKILVQIV